MLCRESSAQSKFAKSGLLPQNNFCNFLDASCRELGVALQLTSDAGGSTIDGMFQCACCRR